MKAESPFSYLKLYLSDMGLWFEQLSYEQVGQLLHAIYTFATSGTEEELPDELRFPYAYAVQQLLGMREKYELRCERNRENGAKGGKAKASNSKRTKSDLEPEDTDKEPDPDTSTGTLPGAFTGVPFQRFKDAAAEELISEHNLTDNDIRAIDKDGLFKAFFSRMKENAWAIDETPVRSLNDLVSYFIFSLPGGRGSFTGTVKQDTDFFRALYAAGYSGEEIEEVLSYFNTNEHYFMIGSRIFFTPGTAAEYLFSD